MDSTSDSSYLLRSFDPPKGVGEKSVDTPRDNPLLSIGEKTLRRADTDFADELYAEPRQPGKRAKASSCSRGASSALLDI